MRRLLAILALAVALAAQGLAQAPVADTELLPTAFETSGAALVEAAFDPSLDPPLDPPLDPSAEPAPVFGPVEEAAGQVAEEASEGRMSTAVEIAVLLTVLSLLPAMLITVTSFTRIVIVLSFVRRSLSVNELPPNPVIVGLALFLTAFVMAPVGQRVWEKAYVPYQEGELAMDEAADVAWGELRTFLVANTRESELALFQDMADGGVGMQASADADQAGAGGPGGSGAAEELPLRVVIPAFILSELKTAFQMGFLLFLPFLVIDLVISSVLLSMGMFMLPPVMISTPFKILLFVLVDGWHLICESLVTSFITG